MTDHSDHSATRPPFECLRCSDCCTGQGGIFLEPDELAPAARHLGLGVDEFVSTYCREVGGRYEVLTADTGVCALLGPRGCRIHPVKPAICRAWPFLPQIVARPEAFEEAKLVCPGLDPKATHEAFVAQAQEIRQKENES